MAFFISGMSNEYNEHGTESFQSTSVTYSELQPESSENNNIWELNYHEAAIFLEVI